MCLYWHPTDDYLQGGVWRRVWCGMPRIRKTNVDEYTFGISIRESENKTATVHRGYEE